MPVDMDIRTPSNHRVNKMRINWGFIIVPKRRDYVSRGRVSCFD